MQGYGSAPKPDLDEDSEPTPFTPRGMAAPPAAPPRRVDADPHRPATIRIEAKTLAPLAALAPLPPHNPAEPPRAREKRRLPRVPMAGERLQALVLAQGLLLNAFVLLLVFGWSSPLPGRRYLLGAFSIGGIVLAVLIHLALRHARQSSSDGARAAPSVTVAWFGKTAARVLPAALVSVWIALGIYALALPPAANAFQEPRPAAAPSQRPPATPAHARPVEGSPVKQTTPPSTRRSWFRW